MRQRRRRQARARARAPLARSAASLALPEVLQDEAVHVCVAQGPLHPGARCRGGWVAWRRGIRPLKVPLLRCRTERAVWVRLSCRKRVVAKGCAAERCDLYIVSMQLR